MKPAGGYIILIFSFLGLMLLRHELGRYGYYSGERQNFKRNNLNERQLKERISSIEFEVDSLRLTLKNKMEEPIAPQVPILPETPKVMLSPEAFKLDIDFTQPKIDTQIKPKKTEKKLGWRWRSEFNTLNDAVKVRDAGNEFSEMAQQEINAAYELGVNDWYGAERAWNSDSFRKRVMEIRNKVQ